MQKKGNTRIIAVAIATMAVIAVAIIALVVIHPFGQSEQEYAIETLKYDYKDGDRQDTTYSVYEYDNNHTRIK